MSKERLEIAKSIRNQIDSRGEFDEDVEVMDWLIEQANLLEKEFETSKHWYDKMMKEKDKNKRYREAIDEAINKCRWNNAETANILLEALEESE